MSRVKYVGSFPVDDLCLDDQIVQLHTQLKALKVSLEQNHGKVWWMMSQMLPLNPSVLQKEEACLRQVLNQRSQNIRRGRDGKSWLFVVVAQNLLDPF